MVIKRGRCADGLPFWGRSGWGRLYFLIPGIIFPPPNIPTLFILFIISRICSNCFIKAFTSLISFPLPFAIRFLRLISIRSGSALSAGVIELIIASMPLKESSFISMSFNLFANAGDHAKQVFHVTHFFYLLQLRFKICKIKFVLADLLFQFFCLLFIKLFLCFFNK